MVTDERQRQGLAGRNVPQTNDLVVGAGSEDFRVRAPGNGGNAGKVAFKGP